MVDTYIHTVLQLGALYGIVAIAVCIAFRFLSFPDLTVDGSFVTGAVLTAHMISRGIDWTLTIPLSFVFGVIAGAITATVHRLFGINKFFAGILVMMILYSINLRILGTANLSIFRYDVIFSPAASEVWTSVVCLAMLTTVALLTAFIFHTHFGLRMRAVGNNAEALRVGPGVLLWLTVAGLGLSNGIAAVAGSLLTQFQRFADVNMGVGVTISGFASLFVGEAGILTIGAITAILANQRRKLFGGSAWPVRGEIVAAAIGALALIAATSFTLYLGLPPSDLKFVSAVILIAAMVFRRHKMSPWLVSPSRFET